MSRNTTAHRRVGALAATVVLAASLHFGGEAPSAGQTTQAACDVPDRGLISEDDLPQGTDVVACDVVGRYMDLEVATMPIPEPGTEVIFTAEYFNGGSVAASTTTTESGELRYDYDQQLAPSEAESDPPSGLPDEDQIGQPFGNDPGPDDTDSSLDERGRRRDGCDSGAFAFIKGAKLRSPLGFRVSTSDGGEPALGTISDTAGAITRSGNTWQNENSPCGDSDLSAVPNMYYAGVTNERADIVGDQCRAGSAIDNTSTIDIGRLPGRLIAGTCSWVDLTSGPLNTIRQADIRFNTDRFDFTYTPGRDCDRQSDPDYDVLSVLTHEMGHVLALDDVYAEPTEWLTMHGAGTACNKSRRNLGRGDAVGIRTRY